MFSMHMIHVATSSAGHPFFLCDSYISLSEVVVLVIMICGYFNTTYKDMLDVSKSFLMF